MILGLAISGDDIVGLIITILLGAYLFYAFLSPEKL